MVQRHSVYTGFAIENFPSRLFRTGIMCFCKTSKQLCFLAKRKTVNSIALYHPLVGGCFLFDNLKSKHATLGNNCITFVIIYTSSKLQQLLHEATFHIPSDFILFVFYVKNVWKIR